MAATAAASLAARGAKVFPGGKFTRWPLQQLRFGPAFLEQGRGCRVWDVDQTEYIDYMSGCAAASLDLSAFSGRGQSSVGICDPSVFSLAICVLLHPRHLYTRIIRLLSLCLGSTVRGSHSLAPCRLRRHRSPPHLLLATEASGHRCSATATRRSKR